MPSRNSHPQPTRKKRIGQLSSRLQALTQDYAPFYAGFSAGSAALGPHKAASVAILNGIQQIRRMPLAVIPVPLSEDEGETGPEQL